ncbi:tetratricopeptide repeat protein [Frateuria terrea]|uniref:protein O-GlcNAc transferase n=1 Tax=Frateuria terrea TaxID=529704 RepID=A0A1H6W840_9GAMM|nr:tetratricopeptide repeat protein [Frateuria terrea]SEJ10227.1 Predicted O-linked N-acetylglucosamine transferase, SPINDLY family [Frateuria terrea]SFP67984.1 Predicted O-linked N-acetylglucosamine transferase, SPINDLY family [Frateuria terrea]
MTTVFPDGSADRKSAMPANARAELEALLQRLGHLLRQRAGGDAEALAARSRQVFSRSGELARLHGIALMQLGRRQEGLAALHRAAELAPDSVEVQCNLANVAVEDGRPEAAIKRLQGALARAPGHPVVLQALGVSMMAAARFEEARGTFAQAVRAAPTHPGLRLNLAEAELERGDATEALAQVREALKLAPRLDSAHELLGHVLHAQGHGAEAAQAWLEAERLAPEEPRHAFQAARMLEDAGALAEASAAYARALQRAPRSGPALSRLAYTRRQLADWREQETLTARLREAVEGGQQGIMPSTLLVEPLDRALQRKAAETFAHPIDEQLAPLRRQLAFARQRPAPAAPIRVGLVSNGFADHPIGRAVVGLVEALSALDGLDLHLFATAADDGGAVRQRLAGAAKMHAIDALAPAQAAREIHAAGIEVLFDLSGYGARTNAGLLALRPAPLQVNWLACPGTSGAPWIDYILADTVVLPPSHRADFSEKVLRLPRCFVPIDTHPDIPPAPTRAECGLPETGVVFACFNATSRIDPQAFARFMRVLRGVPGSMLWLRAGPDGADERLRAAAAALEVPPERLAFLPSLPHEQYLARYALVDLCLDTLPRSARTTAADALWAGCPVLTCAGDTFAGRTAASLLHHAHLSDLVYENADDAADRAVKLGRDRLALAAIRSHLASLRVQSPVFDTAGFAADFRRVVQTIGTRHRIGRPPIDLDF